MKIALTGGSGFIGYRVANLLEIASKLLNMNDGLNRIDLFDCQGIDTAIGAFKPQVILHIAGAKKHPFAVNTYGTFNLLRAAKKHKVKQFVFISSMNIYNSDNPDRYTQSKLMAEKLILYHYPKALILRIGSVYGDGRFPFTYRKIMFAKSNSKRRFIEVNKVANEIVKRTLSHQIGVHNITEEKPISLNEFARRHKLMQIPILNKIIEERDDK
jgi:nucleoside-diphosphate-sugar epimerase